MSSGERKAIITQGFKHAHKESVNLVAIAASSVQDEFFKQVRNSKVDLSLIIVYIKILIGDMGHVCIHQFLKVSDTWRVIALRIKAYSFKRHADIGDGGKVFGF
jgi:hypothetical protein